MRSASAPVTPRYPSPAGPCDRGAGGAEVFAGAWRDGSRCVCPALRLCRRVARQRIACGLAASCEATAVDHRRRAGRLCPPSLSMCTDPGCASVARGECGECGAEGGVPCGVER